MTPLIEDSRRVPRWYSVTLGIVCGLYGTFVAATAHGGWLARIEVAGIGALVALGLFWVFRWSYRQLLAKPLPRRGPGGWLVSLRIWQMVLVQLLGAFAVGLAVGLAYTLMFPAIPAFAAVSGTFITLISLNQVPAWLERRRAATEAVH